MKADRGAFGPPVERRNPGAFAHRLDPHDQHQRVHLPRQFSEPVDEFRSKAFQFNLGRQVTETSVQSKTDIQIGHIGFGDQHRHTEVDLWRPFPVIGDAFRLTGFDLGDLLFQHLLIKLIADFAHLAGLFFAQQIARPPDVEVLAGQRETGPQ